jgi:SagB-type dehydrogenase family enzyme
MKKLFLILILILVAVPGCVGSGGAPANIQGNSISASNAPTFKLPDPRLSSSFSLEESLLRRRSIREYSTAPLTLYEVSQLLWAGQGITSENGGRTAPSAGALYPLEVYLVAGKVDNLASGVYHYNPGGHELILINNNDIREGLAEAALGQTAVKNAALVILITVVYERTTQKYGDRGVRYAQMEVGHAAQNICLQATALNLGTVTIGAFDDNRVKDRLGLADNETPIYIIPVGRTR